jgi:hypothetical protein
MSNGNRAPEIGELYEVRADDGPAMSGVKLHD